MRSRENKPMWPTNCPWPEPLEEGEGEEWEDDDADFTALDEDGRDLLAIKEYMDELVEEGRLDEEYRLNYEEADITPDLGEDYWDEGFDYESWHEDFVNHMNLLKLPYPSPVNEIQRIIDYEFTNENILRQAFTRRAFALVYGGEDSEVLEFIGDTVLNTVLTREMARQVTSVETETPDAPFRSNYDEGELTRVRQHYESKEYLSGRAEQLGLTQFILYGPGEVPTESAAEDMIEAILGAVAVDSDWDWYALEVVVDKLICFQLSPYLLKKGRYDTFNAWHQKHFGVMPNYDMSKGDGRTYTCVLRFHVPKNDKGINTAQIVTATGETRSKAREMAAQKAYNFVIHYGLLVILKDAHVEPNKDESINQLQELYQKGYVEEPSYTFSDSGNEWRCDCACNGIMGYGRAAGKVAAKKKAAFMVIVLLLKSAGIENDEWLHEIYSV